MESEKKKSKSQITNKEIDTDVITKEELAKIIAARRIALERQAALKRAASAEGKEENINKSPQPSNTPNGTAAVSAASGAASQNTAGATSQGDSGKGVQAKPNSGAKAANTVSATAAAAGGATASGGGSNSSSGSGSSSAPGGGNNGSDDNNKSDKPDKKADRKARKEAKDKGKQEAEAEKKAKKEANARKAAEEKARKKAEKQAKKESGGFLDSIETGCAAIIDWHDRVQARIDDRLRDMAYSIVKEYVGFMEKFKGQSESIIKTLFGLVVVICALLLICDHYIVYQYSYNGRALGYVDNQENVQNVLDIASEKLSDINDMNIVFEKDQNITFKPVSAVGKDVDDSDTVFNKLTYMSDIEITAYGIFADGKLSAIVRSEATAKNVIDSVKNHYNNPEDGMKITEIGFENVIEVKPLEAMLSSIQTTDAAINLLEKGGTVRVNHIVTEGESLADIKKTFNADKVYSEGDKKTALTEVTHGEKVIIDSDVKPLIVDVVETGTMSEKVKYPVRKVKTKDLYIGEEEVKQNGVEGRAKITGTIYKQNGVEVARDIESEEIIKEPVEKIILVGCVTRPKTAPTGTYVMPIHNYVISSYYGSRWGTIHGGIDFAAAVGTPIFAADGGTVTRSGYFGGYGLCIDVSHGNGTFTRYGHCSKSLVTVGQKVYQGQQIALVGNTGRSTGPHLHFELHPNGNRVDPLPYLPIGR